MMLKISTKTTGWQIRCWDWVKAGELFELHGVEKTHLLFCHELCAAYKYQCNFSDPSVLAFTYANLSLVAIISPSRQFTQPLLRVA